MNLTRRNLYALRLQYVLGRMAIFVTAPFTYLCLKFLGYRIRDIRKIRASARKIMDQHRGGWIICANHLTMVDSYIIAWALMSYGRFAIDHKSMPWNLPERNNFKKNLFLSALCYLTKCLPVNRGGDRDDMKRTLSKCSYLLEGGSSLLIFPEGGRSRSGTIDSENFSYGVGRMVQQSPSARILCVYLRGIGQNGYSTIPQFGEEFLVQVEPFHPDVTERGLKGQREIASRIVNNLARMEKEWFQRSEGLEKRPTPKWMKLMEMNPFPSVIRKILET